MISIKQLTPIKYLVNKKIVIIIGKKIVFKGHTDAEKEQFRNYYNSIT